MIFDAFRACSRDNSPLIKYFFTKRNLAYLKKARENTICAEDSFNGEGYSMSISSITWFISYAIAGNHYSEINDDQM